MIPGSRYGRPGMTSWRDFVLQIDDPPPRRMCDGICAAGGVELVEQRADVEFRGVDRNPERACDLLVGAAFSEQRQHIARARREPEVVWRTLGRTGRDDSHIGSLARCGEA